MHLRFYHSLHKQIEYDFLKWFGTAAANAGDVLESGDCADAGAELADVGIFWGLSDLTRDVVEAYRAAGRRTLMLDKAAIRKKSKSRHYRVLIDGGTALAYLMRKKRPADRWEAMQIRLKPWRKQGERIIYANNSQRVHDFWRLGNPRDMAIETLDAIKAAMPDHEIIFRPKPHAIDQYRIEGMRNSVPPEKIEDLLKGAHCLVTHTSHCSVDALIAGVPVICLGPNPAQPLAGDSLDRIVNPPMPRDAARYQFFCNLAYCQWSQDELASGEALEFIKGEMAAT